MCQRQQRRQCGPAALAAARFTNPRTSPLNIHLSLTPLISLVAGVLILLMPKLLNFIVAAYLILLGLIGLFGLHLH
jgi:hypothetical protein